jgi:hypothetical protein
VQAFALSKAAFFYLRQGRPDDLFHQTYFETTPRPLRAQRSTRLFQPHPCARARPWPQPLAQGRIICERLGIPLHVDRYNSRGELTWAGRIGPGYAQAEGSEQDLTSLQLMLALTQRDNDNQIELTQMISFVYQLAPSVTQDDLKSFLNDVATTGEASLILDGRIIQAPPPRGPTLTFGQGLALSIPALRSITALAVRRSMARSSFNNRIQCLRQRLFSVAFAAFAALSLFCLNLSPAAARPAGIGITSAQAIALYQEIGVPLGPMKTSNALKNNTWYGEQNGIRLRSVRDHNTGLVFTSLTLQ